jgi:23S rRNA (adenine2030-N6)-methyltransferase
VNYRHAFHAGNFADVLKHAVLVLALARLLRKDAPIAYLDTHAGAGRYDLDEVRATRTAEWRDGIGRVLDADEKPRTLRAYLRLITELNRGSAEQHLYPGSPWLARKLLRPRDRLVLHETVPEASRELRRAMSGDKRVEIHESDGWTALKSSLPPRERRGLVLIDPPFEAKDEYERLARGLRHAHRRFATGVMLAWYPIKTRAPVAAMHKEIIDAGLRRVLVTELLVRGEAGESDETPRMAGAGLVIVNPPWTLAEALAELLSWLAPLLAQGEGATSRLETLVGE